MDGRYCPYSALGLSLQPPPGKKKGKEERREGGVGEDGGRRMKGKEEGKRERHFQQRIHTLTEQFII